MHSRNCSSLHFLFITPEELPVFESMGFLIRHSFQFHWKNNFYQDFDEFLGRLKRKRRKEIIRGRRQIQQQRIKVEVLEGEAIQVEHINYMYEFYLSTYEKKWGRPYLSKDFFSRIHQTMCNKLVLFLAYVDGDCVAGTINFKNGTCLYGRYLSLIHI